MYISDTFTSRKSFPLHPMLYWNQFTFVIQPLPGEFFPLNTSAFRNCVSGSSYSESNFGIIIGSKVNEENLKVWQRREAKGMATGKA